MENDTVSEETNKGSPEFNQRNHVKTGRTAALIGGLLALFLGFAGFSIGYALAIHSEFPPESFPPEMRQEIKQEALQGDDIFLILPGIVCMAGGLPGFAGGVIAVRRPNISGKLMAAGGALSVLSLIGIAAAIILFVGMYQNKKFSTLPPEQRTLSIPEWKL